VQWAAEQGAGNDNLDYILVKGLSIDEAKVRYMSPAEQVAGASGGKVKIYELGACSLCCASVGGPFYRYSKNPSSLLAPVDVVTGPGDWEVPEHVNPRTVLLGDCVQERYRGLGKFVGGCPVNVREYMKTMGEYDIACVKCEKAVLSALEKINNTVNAADTTAGPADAAGHGSGASGDSSRDAGDCSDIAAALPRMRILASGKSVYQGENNKAGMDDYLFAAGKCLEGYIRNHGRRVHKVSDIDVSEFSVYKSGCPITEADVIDGVRELAQKMNRNIHRL
jgi:hypothetical protein